MYLHYVHYSAIHLRFVYLLGVIARVRVRDRVLPPLTGMYIDLCSMKNMSDSLLCIWMCSTHCGTPTDIFLTRKFALVVEILPVQV